MVGEWPNLGPGMSLLYKESVLQLLSCFSSGRNSGMISPEGVVNQASVPPPVKQDNFLLVESFVMRRSLE